MPTENSSSNTLQNLSSLFGNKKKRRSPVKKVVPEGNFTCMNKGDIDRIARTSSLTTFGKRDANTDLRISEEQKERARERARARKEHMIKLDLEVNEKNKLAKKESKQPQVQKNEQKSEDIIKQLKTCKQRAAAFAIRDQQIQDKEIREKEERDYERLMDLEMEMDRLKDLQTREHEKEAKLKKRIADRKVIEDQIKERQHHRLLQEEARDQENRKMLETMKRYEREDATKALQRKEDAKKAKEEIIMYNEQILAGREAAKAFEKKEEEMIVQYLAQREEVLRKREEDEAEIQREKIALQKKLLESQTKILDKRSEVDELRARRAAEEAERRHRKRELEKAQKRKRDMDILHESRKQQQEEQRIAKEREMIEKQEEYDGALRHAAEMAKREHDEAEVAQKKNAELRTMLCMQIEENERRRKLLQKEKYSEGREIKEKMVRNAVHVLGEVSFYLHGPKSSFSHWALCIVHIFIINKTFSRMRRERSSSLFVIIWSLICEQKE